MARLGQGISQIQGLTQTLKPQQILVSSLLQLPVLMLEQRIKNELEVNPVLEEAEEWDELQDEDDETKIEEDPEESKEIEEEFETLEETNKSEEDKLNEELQEEVNLDELVPSDDDDIPDPKMPVDRNEELTDMPEPYIQSMSEYLEEQLLMLKLTETEYLIGLYLIHNLRDDGYLAADTSFEVISQMYDSDNKTIEKVLKKIQQFDPVGIGSRSLKECLIIQLKVKNTDGIFDLPIKILNECYEDFTNRRFEKVADALDISLEEVKEALDIISKLNPKPGHLEGNVKINYIIPDFYVELVEDELVISLNEYKTPGLKISNHYKKMMRQPKKLDKDVKQFLKSKFESAKWFINAIKQRQATMQKTINAIVEKQRDFFIEGPEKIKPMIMKDIAEIIEMDISTVSRVCKGKYVETDHGVFELKYFFNEGMATDDGDDISTLRIKDKLKEIIEKENTRKPLSDDKLASALKDAGMPVARRTVAKYREQLDIPVARLRRSI